jgi:hypothetical protein
MDHIFKRLFTKINFFHNLELGSFTLSFDEFFKLMACQQRRARYAARMGAA